MRLKRLILPCLFGLTLAGCVATSGELTRASMSGDANAATGLLNGGADANEEIFLPDDPLHCSSGDLTPLMAAACHGHLETVKILFAHGADTNAANNMGSTALIMAASKDHPAIANFLLEHSADPNIKSSAGWTALMVASENGCAKIVDSLLRNKADPNEKSNIGGTPLMAAAYNGHADVVKLLLKYGADRGAQNNSGRTAADLALMKEHDQIAELIQPGKHRRAAKETAGQDESPSQPTVQARPSQTEAEPEEDKSTQDIENQLKQLQGQ